MIRPKLEFLSSETVGRAIDEAYELLWNPGVRVHYDEALRLLAEAGATVDFETRVAQIPRDLAEQLRRHRAQLVLPLQFRRRAGRALWRRRRPL